MADKGEFVLFRHPIDGDCYAIATAKTDESQTAAQTAAQTATLIVFALNHALIYTAVPYCATPTPGTWRKLQ